MTWIRARRITGLDIVRIGGVILVIAAVYLQSYNGRVEVINGNRTGCERSAVNLAGIVNNLRDQQIGNAAIGQDPTVPARTRRTRAREAQSEEANLLVLDSHIDRGKWFLLHDTRDQVVVKNGLPLKLRGIRSRVRPFRCNVAYPQTSPFVFVR